MVPSRFGPNHAVRLENIDIAGNDAALMEYAHNGAKKMRRIPQDGVLTAVISISPRLAVLR